MGIGTHHRSPGPATRLHGAAALAWTVCLLAAGALLGACAAQAAPGTTPGAATAPAAMANTAAGGIGDWGHVLQVVAALRARPPAEPLVCLLGGSAARESTVSDVTWAGQVRDAGGTSVVAYNLGSRNRTLDQDVALIRALPRMRGLVYIGVNVGRFTAAPSRVVLDLPSPAASLPPYRQHQYSESQILSVTRKKALLNAWLTQRYPLFKKHYASNLATLERLIVVCQSRGLHPVLFDLPRNRAIIGHALDLPVAQYTASCRDLAGKYGVPWVSLVSAARLPDADFYDLWHLVEPGRAVWQRLLATRTSALLEKYGMGSGGS